MKARSERLILITCNSIVTITCHVDWEASQRDQDEANHLRDAGKYEDAIEKYSSAMGLGSPSTSLLSARAHCLMKLNRPSAAISDCTEALKLNPDSAKALR